MSDTVSDNQAQLRQLLARISKKYRVSHSQSIRMLADMVGRSPATVKRWLSVKPDGTPYLFPPGMLSLAIMRLSGKMTL